MGSCLHVNFTIYGKCLRRKKYPVRLNSIQDVLQMTASVLASSLSKSLRITHILDP